MRCEVCRGTEWYDEDDELHCLRCGVQTERPPPEAVPAPAVSRVFLWLSACVLVVWAVMVACVLLGWV